ncbi:MAG TPA: aldo/keto reductase [Allosphingosinicella sp.]|nr:aldo/keto reductase [Allosphingosinicella sp.]
MPTRPVGRTGLRLPLLGFGAAPLGNLYRPIDDQRARETLRAALEAGLNYVDTAPYYGFGLSEIRVGEVVRDFPGTIVSTKIGRLLVPAAVASDRLRHGFRSPMPFEPMFDYSADGVLRSHEASLERLGLDRVDMIYVHDIGRLTHGVLHEQRLRELDEGGGWRALRELKEAGAVSAIGIGVNEVEICLELIERAPLDIILLAGRYTLLEQTALDTLLPRCVEKDISVVIGGPYNSGILAGGRNYNYGPAPEAVIDRARNLSRICARHNVALGAAALQFVLAHPAVTSVVPGLASPEEVRETLARAAAPIPASLWAELKQEGLLHPDAPTPDREMPEIAA